MDFSLTFFSRMKIWYQYNFKQFRPSHGTVVYTTDPSKAFVLVSIVLCVACRLFAAGLLSCSVLFIVLLSCSVGPI